MSLRQFMLGSVLVASGLAAAAYADGEVRPATLAERAFEARVIAAARAALPGSVSNWQQVTSPDFSEYGVVPVGIESGILSRRFDAAWEDRSALDAEEASRREASERQVASGALATVPEPLQRRQQALAERISAAYLAGDAALAERLMRDLDRVNAEIDQIGRAQDSSFVRALQGLAARDARLNVMIEFNARAFDLPLADARRETLAGWPAWREGPGSFRRKTSGEETEEWVEGRTVVCIGPAWRSRRDAAANLLLLEYPDSDRRNHAELRSILVVVQAEEARAREFLRRIDWNALRP